MHRFHHDEDQGGRGRHQGHGPFGGRGFHPPFPPNVNAWLGGGFGGPGGRARRGDVRSAVLRLLSEEPMHGYQIIQELSARSGGAWRPSAGSVYPTLQLLEDEGLVEAEASGGKRIFKLTEAGQEVVAKTADKPAPWEEAASGDAGGGLREQMPRVGAAVAQIAMTGDSDKIARAAAILSDARKKLFAILAED
jgi:DNA-binding PadR family transcriptional regulator